VPAAKGGVSIALGSACCADIVAAGRVSGVVPDLMERKHACAGQCGATTVARSSGHSCNNCTILVSLLTGANT